MLIVNLPKGETDLTKGEASKAGFEVKVFGRRITSYMEALLELLGVPVN